MGHILEGEIIAVHLIEPKEQLWGRLLSISSAGVTLRGMDIQQVESYRYQLIRKEGGVYPQTLFFPMRRVEKLYLDEPQDSWPSIMETLRQATDLSDAEILNEEAGQ